MTDFKLPELGENVHGGDVLRVLVKAGDTVSTDQPVLELETDKATIEVPSSVSGTVGEIQVKAGDKVKVGQTIFVVKDTKGTKDEKDTKDTKEPAQTAEALRQEAPADREGGQPSKVETPPAPSEPQRVEGRASIPRAPEDEIEEAPRRRGEVVDISRGGPRVAAQ